MIHQLRKLAAIYEDGTQRDPIYAQYENGTHIFNNINTKAGLKVANYENGTHVCPVVVLVPIGVMLQLHRS